MAISLGILTQHFQVQTHIPVVPCPVPCAQRRHDLLSHRAAEVDGLQHWTFPGRQLRGPDFARTRLRQDGRGVLENGGKWWRKSGEKKLR